MEFESIKRSLVGKKYEKFAKKNFSFLAFLFGGLYYVHRKMYLEGIIFYLINIQLSNLTFYSGDSKFMLASLLFSLVYGLLFGGLYRNHINKKANYLVAKQTTSDKDCKKHGRTNFLAVILVMIIVSVFQSNVINKHLYEPLFGNPILNMIKQVVNSVDGVDPNVVKLLNQINTVDDLKNIENLIEQFGLDASASIESDLQDFTDDEIGNEITDNTIDKDTNTVDEDLENTTNTIDEDSNTTSAEENDETNILSEDALSSTSSDNNVSSEKTWNGIFKLDELADLKIYRTSEKEFNVTLKVYNSDNQNDFESSKLTMNYVDEETIQLRETQDSKNNIITLKLTDSGLKIEKVSAPSYTLWEQLLDKEFTRNAFEKTGWDGVYKTDNYIIALSEIEENYLILALTDGFSDYERIFTEYASDEINFKDEREISDVVEVEKIKITKTEKGFLMQSSCSNNPSNAFNDISDKEFIKITN